MSIVQDRTEQERAAEDRTIQNEIRRGSTRHDRKVVDRKHRDQRARQAYGEGVQSKNSSMKERYVLCCAVRTWSARALSSLSRHLSCINRTSAVKAAFSLPTAAEYKYRVSDNPCKP
jgi:hypothetical protein